MVKIGYNIVLGTTPTMQLFLYLFVSLSAFADSKNIDLVEKTIGYMSEQYLWADQMDAKAAFIDAAEAAENAIPWLIVDETDSGLVLKHGIHGVFETIPPVEMTYEDLVPAIADLEKVLACREVSRALTCLITYQQDCCFK